MVFHSGRIIFTGMEDLLIEDCHIASLVACVAAREAVSSHDQTCDRPNLPRQPELRSRSVGVGFLSDRGRREALIDSGRPFQPAVADLEEPRGRQHPGQSNAL